MSKKPTSGFPKDLFLLGLVFLAQGIKKKIEGDKAGKLLSFVYTCRGKTDKDKEITDSRWK